MDDVTKPAAAYTGERSYPEPNVLDVFFSPQSVAVVGATERPGSVGFAVMSNLIGNPFGGRLFPINPNRATVLGVPAYRAIKDVPERVDLAVVVTPAPTVPEVIAQCVDIQVKGAIIISAGFREAGPGHENLEKAVLDQARPGGLRIIGPNCLGVMRPSSGLNATFASSMARPGTIGFLSQSGALCTAILDWSHREQVGFSAFVSIGSMIDVSWGDLISYLGDDPQTKSIILYMESVDDARGFLSAAREVAFTKPILVLKPGRTEGAARAVVSHTGSMTGSDQVLEAAFRRCGVLRVNSIEELFTMAEALAKQPRPRGPRLSIVTNAGGPGVLATDTLLTAGGELAPLSEVTKQALNQILPEHWSRNNPVDILGDAGPDRYAKSVEILAKDSSNDGLLVILTPQAMTDPTRTAESLKAYAKGLGKPILASWMGGRDVETGELILTEAGIPTFAYPDAAAWTFHTMWRFTDVLRGLYETPTLPPDSDAGTPVREVAEQIVDSTRKAGRTVLTEFESKALLNAYGIPTVETHVAGTEEEAVALAEEIHGPAVLKLHSETITHKTDVGGVRVNLRDADSVRQAFRSIRDSVNAKAGEGHFLGVTVQPMVSTSGYEILVGSSVDPQFGPVLLFGSGGVLAEIYKDRALALPPINSTLARRMMERTKIFSAFKGVRGRAAVDLGTLEQVLVRFGQLVVEQRWIREIDINPLMVSAERIVALDARVVLHPRETEENELPRLAIRPYPSQYASTWSLRGGTQLNIRPIRPEDEPLFVKFHETLSERSVYFRFFHYSRLSQRVAHERLTRVCFIDYDLQMALVAERRDPQSGEREIIGVGRLCKGRSPHEAEFAILVADAYQRQGLGTELMRRLIEVARQENLRRLWAYILIENREMQRLCERFGGTVQSQDGTVVKMSIDVGQPIAVSGHTGDTVPEPASTL